MTINEPRVHAEVSSEFKRYERALVENDVKTLIEMFWQNELVIRYGVADVQYGIAALSVFRRTTRFDTRGRRLGPTVITTFGDNFATANTEFRGVDKEVVGRQSQTWARLEEGWRIVSAHVSVVPANLW
jgi:AtzH-like